MARLVTYSVGLSVSILVMFLSDLNGIWFAVSCGLVCGFAIPLLDALLANFEIGRAHV